MTKVEKETLLALLKLGRRTGHSPTAICNERLWQRYGHLKSWERVERGERPRHMYNNEYCQYLSVTEKWIFSFLQRGLVERGFAHLKAGKLNIAMGPFFKLSKEGQKFAKKLS